MIFIPYRFQTYCEANGYTNYVYSEAKLPVPMSLRCKRVYKSLLTWFIMLKLSEIYWKITTINVNIATFVFYFTRVGEFLIIYPGLKNLCSSEPSPVFTFRQKDRVIHLTLLSVRKRYRKFGIGKYLLQVCIIIKIRSFSTSTY